MAAGPVKSGAKVARPPSGKNGAGDKGPSSGTKHYAPPMPKTVRTGVAPGKK